MTMNTRTMVVGVLLAALVGAGAVPIAGCGFGRSAVKVVDDVPLPHPPAPKPVPHAPVPVDDAAVAARQDEMLVPVTGLYAEERRRTIEVACWLKTAYDLGQITDDT